jgi:hexosaminidase
MWLSLLLLYLFQSALSQSLQPQIPSVQSFSVATGQQPFVLTASVQITVDSQWEDLGSPNLTDFANTFRADLVDVLGFASLPRVITAASPDDSRPTIFLTLDPTLNHTLFNGKSTDEGYDFQISSTTYTITGSAPIGVWWGTRTLLQQAALIANAAGGNPQSVSFPAGSGSDSPGWEIRGFMLDAGRHDFLTSFLCKFASYFK